MLFREDREAEFVFLACGVRVKDGQRVFLRFVVWTFFVRVSAFRGVRRVMRVLVGVSILHKFSNVFFFSRVLAHGGKQIYGTFR